MLKYENAEAELGDFLSRFAAVETIVKKARWAWEARFRLQCQDAENPRRKVPQEMHVHLGDDVLRALDLGDAESAYRELSSRSEHRYVVLPEQPPTIGFLCEGRLPGIEDWRSLEGNGGLAFGIVVLDQELKWLFGMSAEWPGLGAYFAARPTPDVE